MSDRDQSTDKPYLVSACLAGVECRYDCQAKPNPQLIEWVEKGEALAVCPEELGGLPTPRPPAEQMEDGRVLTIEGHDVTLNYEKGAQRALELAKSHGVKKAYLKGKSPMCGVGQIYDGSFQGQTTQGDGKFAKSLKDAGIETIETEPAAKFDKPNA